MIPASVTAKAHDLSKILRRKEWRLCIAESCTGGLVSVAMTDIPGSSEVFERGYVTYSNDSKIELLTVPTFYIEEYGAVSKETATAMAEGALLMSKADVSISITGIAGPDGGTEEKPVGTVFIAWAAKGRPTKFKKFFFNGSRPSIRMQAAETALELLIGRIELMD